MKDIKDKLGLKPDYQAYTLHAPINYKDLLPHPISLSKVDEQKNDFNWL